MFKKHIAINQNGHQPTKALNKREMSLRDSFLTPSGLKNGLHKEPQAIDSLKKYPTLKIIQQATNKRLLPLETLLKQIFQFQNISFLDFCLKNENLFKQRFKQLQKTSQELQNIDSDASDHEAYKPEQITKQETIKLLRLYLRLYIRKAELTHVNRNSEIETIGYPQTSIHNQISQRGQKENGYSELEAYRNLRNNTIVLSKSSFLSQKDQEPDLFNENEEMFLTTVLKILKQPPTDFDPFRYEKSPPLKPPLPFDDQGCMNYLALDDPFQ